MFARFRLFKYQSGMRDEAMKHSLEAITPIAETSKGFRAIFQLESTEDPDIATIVSIWDSEKDAMDFEYGDRMKQATSGTRGRLVGFLDTRLFNVHHFREKL